MPVDPSERPAATGPAEDRPGAEPSRSLPRRVSDAVVPAVTGLFIAFVHLVTAVVIPAVRALRREAATWWREEARPALADVAAHLRTETWPAIRGETSRARDAIRRESRRTVRAVQEARTDAGLGAAVTSAAASVSSGVRRAGSWLRHDAGPRLGRRAREFDEAMSARGSLPDDRPTRARSAVRLGALVVGLTVVAALAALPGVVAVDRTVAEVGAAVLDVDPLPEEFEPLDHRSRVVAADGSLLAILSGPENRVTVTLDQVPQVTRDAVIATEDSRFYEHQGVNHRAMLRAMVANVADQAVTQGGSTITQQYVKNALLTPEQTVERKLEEAIYATRLERELSKDEILERYLNITYFGNGVYGIGTAAEFYFGKDISELTAAESALLAGMIRAPEVNDPVDAPEAARVRRDIVLDQMQAQGRLTPEEADAARASPLQLQVTPLPPPTQPFFVEYVKQQLLDDPRLGETRSERAARLFGGGLEIRTTLDPAAQTAALDAIRTHLSDPGVDPLGGIISLDPRNGAVRTMAVGPKAFGECAPLPGTEQAPADGQARTVANQDTAEQPPPCTNTKVNPLVRGLGGSGRQAGSTFKPILDTAALDAGIPTSWHTSTRSTPIPECGRPGEPWTPANYSGGSAGVLDMPEGIRRSNNVFHAKLIAEIGPQAVVDMAHRLGIEGELQPFCSLGLGAQEVFPIDMAQAFGTLANEGVRCEPFAVTDILDRAGEVIAHNEPSCERVLDPAIARTMTTMLRRVVESGTATAANIGRPVAGKTGTTDDFVDAWFIGYIPQLVTAAWMGHEQPRCSEGQTVGCGPMRGILGYRVIAGGTIPARMWADYMRVATAGLEVEPLPREPLDRYVPPPPPDPEPAPGPPDRDDDENKKKKKKRGRGGD